MKWGVGTGASRLVSGTMTVHKRLEDRLANFKGTDSALLFGSGYLANTGVIAALAEKGGLICSDELNHASLIDGCRLSGAETFVYDHCDPDHLAWGLHKAKGRPALVVTDSVFSMDGDVAPLAQIVDVAQRYRAGVVVDEAHATGVLGPGGRGVVAQEGLQDEVTAVIGTLGKALGSYGAYAACDARTAEWILNRARTLLFSTAPPPPAVAGALAALDVLESEPRRIERLHTNSSTMRIALRREGFDIENLPTPIIPLVIGEASDAMALCEAALEDGVFAQAIRPPTVAEGSSRLRLTVMATHQAEELRNAASVIATSLGRCGLRVAAPAERRDELAPDGDAVPIRASRNSGSKLFDVETEAPRDLRSAA
jgi:glycine C-acetyltransferase/8-amino-7-oxononanoate synthase